MNQYVVSTCWFLLSSFTYVQLSPVREKISINTDLLNKVREGSNQTGGGHGRNERVHNFAWRVSVTITTTAFPLITEDSALTTLLSVDELEKNPEHNKIIHNQLMKTLKDPNYRKIWQSLVKQDYKKLITEMRQPGACKIFIKDDFDGTMEGPAGEALYTKLVNFLDAVGIKGYNLILDTAVDDNIPTFSDEYTTRKTTITTTTTTEQTTTIRYTTISVKEIEQHGDFFLKVYVQMSITLKHKEYRDMWNYIIDTQGYPTLLQEMRKNGAHRRFMKDNGDKAWDGPDGVKLYETVVNFLHTIGLSGYKVFLESAGQIPLTAQEELGLTPGS